MRDKRIAVIGRQRSGTTVFRQFIGSSEISFDLGEIFHSQTDLCTNFWGFLHSRASEITSYRHPINWSAAWADFVSEQTRIFSAGVLVFDAKIDYLPLILRNHGTSLDFFFDDPNMCYLYLARRNIAAQVISRYFAIATNRWLELDPNGDMEGLRRLNKVRGISPQSVSLDRLVVNPNNLLEDIRYADEQNQAFIGALRAKLNLFEFVYEELFDCDGCFCDAVTFQIADITGIDPAGFARKPIMMRQSDGNFLKKVANREEIEKHMRGSKYEWMLK